MDLRCTHCRQIKPETDFPANPKKQNGFSSWCCDCHNEASQRSHQRAEEREAPIREAERKIRHAEFMAESRANLRERQKQIARNRRALERRRKQAPPDAKLRRAAN
jgi:hypothetical protein